MRGTGGTTRFPKDGIGDHLLHGSGTVNPDGVGTKAAAHVRLEVPAGGQAAVLVRLTREGPELTAPFTGAGELIAARRAEADEFYDAITPPAVGEDAKAVMRQALAGMLWSKQCYYFDVDLWLRERHAHPLRAPGLKVECPTGSGTMMTLFEVAQELSRRLAGTFLRDGDGRRPVYGATRLFQEDPHWRDLILFYEYFHGDNGAGLGASHQTGWTGLVARLIQTLGQFSAADVLDDRQWPMARPYRTAGPIADAASARRARGVTERESSR